MIPEPTTPEGETMACALCLSPGETLLKSHIIPAWAYRRVGEGNPHFAWNRYASGPGGWTNMHFRLEMLCEACEAILSTGGEELAAALAYQREGRFPLAERLRFVPAAVGRLSTARRRRLARRGANGIDCAALIHFALGVLWKASTARHLMLADRGQRRYAEENGYAGLPPDLAEQIRLYLLGSAALPPSIDVHLTGLDQSGAPVDGLHRVMTLPVAETVGPGVAHEFLLCGLHFHVFLGPALRRGGLQTNAPRVHFARANEPPFLPIFRTAIDVADGAPSPPSGVRGRG